MKPTSGFEPLTCSLRVSGRAFCRYLGCSERGTARLTGRSRSHADLASHARLCGSRAAFDLAGYSMPHIRHRATMERRHGFGLPDGLGQLVRDVAMQEQSVPDTRTPDHVLSKQRLRQNVTRHESEPNPESPAGSSPLPDVDRPASAIRFTDQALNTSSRFIHRFHQDASSLLQHRPHRRALVELPEPSPGSPGSCHDRMI